MTVKIDMFKSGLKASEINFIVSLSLEGKKYLCQVVNQVVVQDDMSHEDMRARIVKKLQDVDINARWTTWRKNGVYELYIDDERTYIVCDVWDDENCDNPHFSIYSTQQEDDWQSPVAGIDYNNEVDWKKTTDEDGTVYYEPRLYMLLTTTPQYQTQSNLASYKVVENMLDNFKEVITASGFEYSVDDDAWFDGTGYWFTYEIVEENQQVVRSNYPTTMQYGTYNG